MYCPCKRFDILQLWESDEKILVHIKPTNEPDGGGSLEDVEILQDVRHTHQSHRSEEPQTYPCPVQVDGDK